MLTDEQRAQAARVAACRGTRNDNVPTCWPGGCAGYAALGGCPGMAPPDPTPTSEAGGLLEPTLIQEGFYVTVDDYAAHSGISPATIRRRCSAKQMESTKVGKAWLVRVGSAWGKAPE